MKRLSAEEEQRRRECLEIYYLSHGSKYCGELLGMSSSAVRMQAKRFGLAMSQALCQGHSWNQLNKAELQFVIENYTTMGPGDIARKLNRHVGTITRVRKELALPHAARDLVKKRNGRGTRRRVWTKKLDDFVIANYPKKGGAWVAAQLNKTVQCIRSRAKFLNVRVRRSVKSQIIKKALKGRKHSPIAKQRMREAALRPEKREQQIKSIHKATIVRSVLCKGSKQTAEHIANAVEAKRIKRAERWREDVAKLENWAEGKLKENDNARDNSEAN